MELKAKIGRITVITLWGLLIPIVLAKSILQYQT